MNELRLGHGQLFDATLDRQACGQGKRIERVERFFDLVPCQLTEFQSIGRRRLNEERPLVQILATFVIGCFCPNEDIHRNFRFGLQARASYAPPALNTSEFPLERAPARSTALRWPVFARLTSPACCCVTDSQILLRSLLARPQILQPQPHATRSAPAEPRSAEPSGQTGVDADAPRPAAANNQGLPTTAVPTRSGQGTGTMPKGSKNSWTALRTPG